MATCSVFERRRPERINSLDISPTSSGPLRAPGTPKTRAEDYFCASPDASSDGSVATPAVASPTPVASPTLSVGHLRAHFADEPARRARASSGTRSADDRAGGWAGRAGNAFTLRKNGTQSAAPSRKSSIGSISFAPPKQAGLPQGNQKRTDSLRIRASSPPPQRFQSHVAFDSLVSEPTKVNIPSLTLNVRHKGYQFLRRSRTFMAGVDENAYSDYALQWLLDELVDDGDEVVCVRVVEKEFRPADNKAYQEEAMNMMKTIIAKNGASRAISVILEYAFGKVASTFQKMIRMYQPGMLIVGTRGRSLGGLQALVNTRSSFSKYCLQYSPVPVVVVRPPEKRTKKREKRFQDPGRQTYTRMLSDTGGKHETEVESAKLYHFEPKISADEEAHHVARVLGLPASFDPTIKPLGPHALLSRPSSHASPPAGGGAGGATAAPSSSPAGPSAPPSAGGSQRGSVPASPTGTGGAESEPEEEDEDEEGEFEVVSGQRALEMSEQKKERLHEMEMSEAAALRLHGEVDEEEEE